MTDVLERYRHLIETGELRADPDQAAAAKRLAALQAELEAVPPRGSTLWKLLRRLPDPPRGLYIWGGVGRGKSMLMDLFFDCVKIHRKRRTHFHEFMLEVHGCAKRANRKAAIRSRLSSIRWRTKRGCCASMKWWSTIWPTRRLCRGCLQGCWNSG
mgnify:CR=1 FL=1